MLPYNVDNLTWGDFCFYWLRNILIRKDGVWARARMNNIRVLAGEPESFPVDFSNSSTLGEIERDGGLLTFGRGKSRVSVRPSELFDSTDIITYTPPLGYMVNCASGRMLYLESTASRQRNRGLDGSRISQQQPLTEEVFLGLLAPPARYHEDDHDILLDSIVFALNNGHPTGLPDDRPNPLALRPEAEDRLRELLTSGSRYDCLVWTPSIAIFWARGNESTVGAIVAVRGRPWAALVLDGDTLVLRLQQGQAGNAVITQQFFNQIKGLKIEEVPNANN